MTRLSTFQRLALAAASTTVITGGALAHGVAFAAPAAPHTATVVGHLDAATRWKKITDDPSGITVQLPGKPETQKTSDNGVSCRDYLVRTGYGAMGFTVFDAPGSDPTKPWDLKAGLKAAVDGYNSEDPSTRLRSTDAHDGTKDGHHYVEANLAGDRGKVGHIRLVDLGQQAIMIMTVGTGDQRAAVDGDYQQVVHSIQVPQHAAPKAEGPVMST